jgi:3-dehydroquinate synthase
MKATVQVGLGERSYQIHLVGGGLAGLGSAMVGVCSPGPVVVVTNPVVGALYADAAIASLQGAGFAPVRIDVPDGEAHKTVATWHALVEELLAAGVDRKTAVVALGGGVTGDIAGFAAATVKRGLPLVQVPTTLLAMVDSAVGGKTGVNSPRGKNLVGAFWQPQLVYAAMDTLTTLDEAEVRSGLGEVVKHGIIRDAELFAFCERETAAIRARDPAALAVLVERSCEVKAAVVAADERESGLRAILNCGHTVGHAIETVLGHGTLRHGECVAIGLLAEARWAEAGGHCAPGTAARVGRLLSALGLVQSPPPLSRHALEIALGVDKKVARGTLLTAVIHQIGDVRLAQIPVAEAAEMLHHVPESTE